MKELLCYRDQRILKLTELLILNSKPISIESIMKENNCSLKTVYDDIKYLENTWGHILNIDISLGQVYSPNPSISDLMLVKQEIYGNTLAIKIALSLYLRGPQSMADLIHNFHYSESKTRLEIIKCNKFLKEFDIEIVLENGNYYIKAKNEYVVAYLASLSIIGSGYPENIYTQIEEMKERSQLCLELPSVIRDELLLTDSLYLQFSHDYKANIIDDICALLKEEFFKDIEASMEGLYQDYYEIKDALENVFKAVYFKMVTFNAHRFYMHRYFYFYKLFSVENKHFIQRYETFLRKIDQKWQTNFFNYREELLFLLYTNIPNLRVYRNCKVGIYSDLGKEHCRVIIQRLEKYFLHHSFVMFDENKDYDLILSTSKKEIVKINPEYNVLEISDYITSDDCYNIYQVLYSERCLCEQNIIYKKDLNLK